MQEKRSIQKRKDFLEVSFKQYLEKIVFLKKDHFSSNIELFGMRFQ